MKILIPYDGTKAAEIALLDLQNAGFGQTDEILVVITDVFLPESAEEFFNARRMCRLNLEKSGTYSFAPARRQFEEERFLSRQIRRLFSALPLWNIRVETLPGASLVSSEILEKAASWKADVIVLGSKEGEAAALSNGYKSGLWRVVSEAGCSVRLARRANPEKSAISPDSVQRIIAVLDGSEQDAMVIGAVARRHWSAESKIRLIKANGKTFPEQEKLYTQNSATLAHYKPKQPHYKNALPSENERFPFNQYAKLLEVVGLSVSTTILKAKAPPFFINPAIRDWQPDCVFIADAKSSAGKRTSAEQAASDDVAGMILRRAKCSVEIIRSTEKNEQIPKPAARRRRKTQSRIMSIKTAPTAVTFWEICTETET